MGERHVSDVLHLSKGHSHFNFVDVNLLSDQELFIDPCLILSGKSKFCKTASSKVTDYFDTLFNAYRNKNQKEINRLLSFAHEVNELKLGYGNGYNGHGSSLDGLSKKFFDLQNLCTTIVTLTSAADITLVLKNFDRDCMSDLIANIIMKELIDFSNKELLSNGLDKNQFTTKRITYWDNKTHSWKVVSDYPVYINPVGLILLVPKEIVRHIPVMTTDRFIAKIICENIQKQSMHLNAKGKQVPDKTKKEIKEKVLHINKKNKLGVVKNSIKDNPKLLTEFHDRMSELSLNKTLNDKQLDAIIYKKAIS